MKEVAARQELSLKYIEKIMPALSKNQLAEGIHGKGGGYRLTKNCRLQSGDILRLAEGDLAPVNCLTCHAPNCSGADTGSMLPMWKEFYQMVNNYFDGITLADLLEK